MLTAEDSSFPLTFLAVRASCRASSLRFRRSRSLGASVSRNFSRSSRSFFLSSLYSVRASLSFWSISSTVRWPVGPVMPAAAFFLAQSLGRTLSFRFRRIAQPQKSIRLIGPARAAENCTPPIRSFLHLRSAISIHLVRITSIASASSHWASVRGIPGVVELSKISCRRLRSYLATNFSYRSRYRFVDRESYSFSLRASGTWGRGGLWPRADS